jgi:starch synthase
VKILFVTSEALPYYKSGGLADVSRALPDALLAAGHDVRIIMPLYGVVRSLLDDLNDGPTLDVPWPTGPVQTRLLSHRAGTGATAVLVEQPALFEAGSPYEGASGEPLEVGRRFAFFCRAVVRYASEWRPDVIHLNDWTTGFVPVFSLVDGLDVATVFSIHNLAYQGNFSPVLLEQAGVPWDLYRTENGVEFLHTASFLKAGLSLSDRLLTVSPSYAEEIQTPEYGAGLDGLLRFRRRVLDGILNGIDTAVWDPARDDDIASRYTAGTLDGKDTNRNALLKECGLDGFGPVFAMVGRMVYQKGIDIAAAALPVLLEGGARFVILGDGDPAYVRLLLRSSHASPDRVSVFTRFDEALAHRIYAGADYFLMPSRYEPCGLGQMIAQRYGTPPVARRTGGLIDTVTDRKTGFLFDEPTPDALVGAVRRASAIWRVKGWNALRRRCMLLDRSWARSAEQYEAVYLAAQGIGRA